jgi:hypothetical protein
MTDKDFPQRTDLQNKAIHVYFQQVADELNAAGIPYKLLIEGAEITNTAETIKSLFRLIGGAKFRKYSTSELTTKQLMEVYEDFNQILAGKGVHVDFPSNEINSFNKEYEKR